MRVVASWLLVLLCAACGQGGGASTSSVTTSSRVADPAGIDRIRSRLPAAYEIATLPKPPMPVTFWGFTAGWAPDPVPCGVLVTVAAGVPVRGWSASGPGGIVYALAAPGAVPSREVIDECANWTLGGGRTTASVSVHDGPPVPDATTIAMTADIATRVENGTETRSHATTLIAYTDALAISVTVVTDPGAGGQPQQEQLPEQMLGAAVRAIRGVDTGSR